PRGGAERVLAADRDQAVDVKALHRLLDALEAVLALERIGARGAEDGAAARQDPTRGLDRELRVGVLERTAPAVAEADDRVAVAIDPLADDRPDHRIQARAVTAPRENSDPHRRQHTDTQPRNGG